MQLDDATVASPSNGDPLPVRLYLTNQAMAVGAIVFPPHVKYRESDPDYSETDPRSS